MFRELKIGQSLTRHSLILQEYKNPDGWTSNAGNILTSIALSGIRDYKKITSSILNDVQSDRDMEVLKAFLEIL